MNQIEPLTQTPEQLVQFLEAQRIASRMRREAGQRNRASFLTIGFLLIVAIAGIALAVLSSMLPERSRGPAPSSETATSSGR